jgi:hypothetical protein
VLHQGPGDDRQLSIPPHPPTPSPSGVHANLDTG